MDLMTPDVQLYLWAWLNWLLLVIDAAFVLYAIVQLLQDKTWSSIAKWIWAVHCRDESPRCAALLVVWEGKGQVRL